MAVSSKDVEMPVTVRKLSIAAEEIREAIEVEHNLTFLQAVKLYPKAIGWSMYFSLGVVMLGICPVLGLYLVCSDRGHSIRPSTSR